MLAGSTLRKSDAVCAGSANVLWKKASWGELSSDLASTSRAPRAARDGLFFLPFATTH